MNLIVTTALRKIQKLKARIRIVQGGARAGKTMAIVMCLIDIATNLEPRYANLIISIVSETMPHLKKGAMREFILIMQQRGYWEESRWNRTDSIYTFPNGTIIEFFSADSPDKVRGPGRDILFVNEANNVPYETYRQLALRTRRAIYVDYNPVAEFYVHQKLMQRADAEFIKLTYLDNEALPKAQVREIEQLRGENDNLWRIYGLGEVGINEGQVFTNWDLDSFDEPPEAAELLRHGLDFGYTNDPSADIDVYKWERGFILDEVLYKTGQSNHDLANAIRASEGFEPVQPDGSYNGRTRILTVGDSSEPKSIDELKDSYGILITGAVKGEGSVNFGIQLLQQQHIYVTKRSTNIIKEYRNYLWKKDKRTEEPLNVPVDAFNHAMDAARYAVSDVLANKRTEFRVRSA